jgi:hypothetical protein
VLNDITKKSARPIGIEMQTPIPWPIQLPEHVARAIVRGIEHDRRSACPSTLFRLVLPLDRLLPFTRCIEQRLELRGLEKWQAKR